MRIYNMKCLHALCGRAFDWHTKPDIYDVSSGASSGKSDAGTVEGLGQRERGLTPPQTSR